MRGPEQLLASRLLRDMPVAEAPAAEDGLYQRLMAPLLDNRGRARLLLWLVLGLFIGRARRLLDPGGRSLAAPGPLPRRRPLPLRQCRRDRPGSLPRPQAGRGTRAGAAVLRTLITLVTIDQPRRFIASVVETSWLSSCSTRRVAAKEPFPFSR